MPASEAGHASRARRLSVGEPVVLFDGRGGEGAGVIVRCASQHVEVAVDKLVHQPRPRPALTLAVAMPKGPRQDTLIAKCAELGMAGLQPVLTERSICRASEHKLDKWRKITIEAAKQSQQAWLPAMAGNLELADFLRRLARPREGTELLGSSSLSKRPSDAEVNPGIEDIWREQFDRILLADTATTGPTAAAASIRGLLDDLESCKNVLAFVGPEGGWTKDEIRWILETRATPVSLGPNILRIETAAIALAAFFHGLASKDNAEPPLDEMEY
ncbi:MAG: 16S rRNA (uracil(1498)-N(3))-methyltransferase [Phycisphaerales bacterium]|nr:16S rRNA (uracil(1498)-N(3))-methyltransferase [Phycisphaerales bacterium]